MHRTVVRILAAAACMPLFGFMPAPVQNGLGDRAPFMETPAEHVDLMLRLAAPGPSDVLYDLGSGDGRIPITAVRRFGVPKAVGIEIDPELVKASTANARNAGVADRVEFREGNVFTADFSEATIVTLYLLQHLNLALRPRLLEQLRPGTRIVSYEFHLGDWLPDRRVPEDNRNLHEISGEDEGLPYVFQWTVPARVAGSWRLAAGGDALELRLTQSFQQVAGDAAAEGGVSALTVAPLQGTRIRMTGTLRRDAGDTPFAIDATVSGDRMDGTFTAAGQSAPLRGVRVD